MRTSAPLKMNNTRVLWLFLLFLSCQSLSAQVGYTANDQVTPYNGGFHPSANLGEYTAFSDEQLAVLAAGGKVDEGAVTGAGIKALRPGLFESFMEEAGYQSRVPAYEFFKQLGMNDHTVIVGFPSPQHRDPTQYCPGIPSEMFANLYEPIWDAGANGTPYNDDNYYAAYLYKTVSLYKDYVRFWEIWNEPGYDYTGGLGYQPPGAPGNWWDNNPDPCDYKLRAPIFHYIRTLRISWEIIKTVDPTAYVVVSGTGYPSFLDAILRNTDNPADGSPTPDYPLKGGAYFDVMGFHSYPHFDGSLREWSNTLNNWIYYRHSDAAAEGILKTQAIFRQVLDNYGYDGTIYPEKLWMITEVNLPRKQFGEYIGSAEAQKNFIIKAMTTAMMHDFLQLHIYKLGEDTYYDGAYSEFDLMGLYKRLNYNNQFFQEMNDEGMAHKTASDRLFGKIFDPGRTAQLDLDSTMGGGAFRDEFGNFTYVLWAKTKTDLSENAAAIYSFPSSLGISNLLKSEWDASLTHDVAEVSPMSIALSATPIFLSERIFSMSHYKACVPFSLQLTPKVAGAVSWYWEIQTQGSAALTFTVQSPTVAFSQPGIYDVTLEAKNAEGQVIGRQTLQLYAGHKPEPAFSFEVSGPVVHFDNLTPPGDYDFTWDFGDGLVAQEPNPTHVYLQSGAFTVSLKAQAVGCSSTQTSAMLTVVSPGNSSIGFTANDTIPAFTGQFRPGTSWDFVAGWKERQIADIAAGNPVKDVQGAGLKSLRTFVGESYFLENGYADKLDLFKYYQNLDLKDHTFLLAFPSVQSRDPNYYCPDKRSAIFKDLYLDIWDNGENGTPVNDDNPFALYVWNTVHAYKDFVKYWEIYNSPDFDLTGDKAWLPPGEPGNWWENNPDPCDYELRAPIFYYVRSLRIAYEIIHFLDSEAYVTISGIAFPSFLDAVCRNTDNPFDGSVAAPYPLKGGAYFDAVGFKSYPHIDGSTVFFDLSLGAFVYERHSDAAVSGIFRVRQSFDEVLEKYGYDGTVFPRKEWIISEANLPRKQIGENAGSQAIQRNWVIKAWVEAVKNDIRRLNLFKLAESETYSDATDPFQIMGLYQKIQGLSPYNQVITQEGIALKTCSDLLFGTQYNAQKTAAMQLPPSLQGAAFEDAQGHFTYVLWAVTHTDQSEAAAATYSFPAEFGISQLHRRAWDFSQTGQTATILTQNIALTGAPVFLSEIPEPLMPPVAFFKTENSNFCVNQPVVFSDLSLGNPDFWQWSFPGGVPSSFTGKTPPGIIYSQPGTYSVRLWVKNAAGEHEASYDALISVQSHALADFDFLVDGATVQFVNLSQHANQYQWCFGDGFCDNPVSPLYTYFHNGTYQVTLIATGNCGTDTATATLSIAAVPKANFIHNFWGNCGELLTQFVDQSHFSPSAWQWTFEDGTPASSSQQFPVTTFSTGGWKQITLVVSNAVGADTLVRQVYIEGPVSLEQTVELCKGSTFGDQVITQDTVMQQLFHTAVLGCDSLVVSNIFIKDHLETYYVYSLCEGDWFHGVQVYSDTVFIETTPLPAGCDSTSTSLLRVFQHEATFLTETIEQGEFVVVGSQFFTETGVYDVLLQTAQGCDSLVTLDLTVLAGQRQVTPGAWSFRVFPNPFSTETQCSFQLERPQQISLDLYDLQGKWVKKLVQDLWLPAGEHRLFLPKDWPEQGIFWLRLKTASGTATKKVVAF